MNVPIAEKPRMRPITTWLPPGRLGDDGVQRALLDVLRQAPARQEQHDGNRQKGDGFQDEGDVHRRLQFGRSRTPTKPTAEHEQQSEHHEHQQRLAADGFAITQLVIRESIRRQGVVGVRGVRFAAHVRQLVFCRSPGAAQTASGGAHHLRPESSAAFLTIPVVLLLACWGLPQDVAALAAHRRHQAGPADEVVMGRIVRKAMAFRTKVMCTAACSSGRSPHRQKPTAEHEQQSEHHEHQQRLAAGLDSRITSCVIAHTRRGETKTSSPNPRFKCCHISLGARRMPTVATATKNETINATTKNAARTIPHRNNPPRMSYGVGSKRSTDQTTSIVMNERPKKNG